MNGNFVFVSTSATTIYWNISTNLISGSSGGSQNLTGSGQYSIVRVG
jgi:hypothetical protein